MIAQTATIPAARAANSKTSPPSSNPKESPATPQGNVDLTVTALNTSAVVTDSQTLVISGDLGVTIRNIGADSVNAQFRVIAFEDRNGNGAFNQGVDLLLGSKLFIDGVPATTSASLSISLSGTVTFKGNLIYVGVDSENAIAETNEANNIRNTGQNSQLFPPVGQFNPVLKWSWTGSNVEPDYRQVIVTPIVANLNDDNNDGRVDTNDIPDVIFATSNRLDGNLCSSNEGILRAISGRDGSQLFSITATQHRVRPCSPVAVGDLDGDRLPEIVAVQQGRLVIFKNDGSFKSFSASVDTRPHSLGGPSIADINGDGSPEIIYGATAMNNNGGIIFSFPDVGNGSWGAFSTIADLDLNGAQEIITGFRAYKADGSAFYNAGGGDGWPAVGNFDNDANPEVVVVRDGSVYLLEHNGVTKWGPVSIGGGLGGPPTVADYDGDGQPEIGVAGSSFYSVDLLRQTKSP